MQFGQVPGTIRATQRAYGAGQAGRPKQVKPKFVVQPVSGHTYAWTMSNTDPEVLTQVQSTYMQNVRDGVLPPALQPTRSTALQNRTNRAISTGWQKNIGRG